MLIPKANAGTLFSCTESPGVTIITDSPAQLSQCRPLTTTVESPLDRQKTSPIHAEKPISPALPTERHRPPSTVSVPLERVGSLFVVTIQVNETRPARLVLDTGASHTILSHAVARDLGLLAVRHTATLHTVGGPVQADLVPIASIRIAEAEVRDSLAAIHDLPDGPPGVEGLLGLSVLRQFEVTLDTARNRLHLGRPQ